MFTCHATGQLQAPGVSPVRLPIAVWNAIYPERMVKVDRKMVKHKEGQGVLIATEGLFSPEGVKSYTGPTVLGTKKLVEYEYYSNSGDRVTGKKWVIVDETNANTM